MPIEFVHYYMDRVHNLHAFLRDYPSVSREQALAAIEERLLERIDSLISSDREHVSGQPRFNGTRMTVYTLVDHLAYGDDIDTYVKHELSAELASVARLLVEFYVYRTAFERMDNSQ